MSLDTISFDCLLFLRAMPSPIFPFSCVDTPALVWCPEMGGFDPLTA